MVAGEPVEMQVRVEDELEVSEVIATILGGAGGRIHMQLYSISRFQRGIYYRVCIFFFTKMTSSVSFHFHTALYSSI